ncbi:hypothetical protein [Halarcobacter ebronensis]|uniref:Uncharacterized protein n=1 Tax=Halarcobacter ebronensis TaxID=1462615 RepID=A0A4Q1AMX2_9BACT|nr:hypothetical protein [Halarcobacter ebronensis]QKF81508.1 hypothetical protein AEBR_1011 [Halarcobacter ebronensis]RXK05439.1 hypothetical protein CRV07_07965 [Halarcobacter ebronensis]
MNFENYNKIYQEILDDENNQLSANYLLNKYEIKHDEELINILNQIKKNEYISSDNKVINTLLKELNEDDELLDINEIIDIKEKVISTTNNIEEKVEIASISQEKDITKKEKIINIINILKLKIKDNTNKDFFVQYKKYAIPTFTTLFILFLTFFIFNKEDKSIPQQSTLSSNESIKEINSIEINKKDELTTNNISTNEKIDNSNNISTLNDDIYDENLVVMSTENVAEKLDRIVTYSGNLDDEINKYTEESEEELNRDLEEVLAVNTPSNVSSNEIKLNSLDEIHNYKNKIKYQDGSLVFNEHSYNENDMLFGFKIYKLTPIYVKFQDEKNHLRKQILFK